MSDAGHAAKVDKALLVDAGERDAAVELDDGRDVCGLRQHAVVNSIAEALSRRLRLEAVWGTRDM